MKYWKYIRNPTTEFAGWARTNPDNRLQYSLFPDKQKRIREDR